MLMDAMNQMKKRSSLKMRNVLTKEQLEQFSNQCKRLSVNWDKSINFKSLKMKRIQTSFEEAKCQENECSLRMKMFDEKRRNSDRNEFDLVRELLNNKSITEEEEDDENAIVIKENTQKNIEFGKQCEMLSDDEGDSCSHSNDNDNNDVINR